MLHQDVSDYDHEVTYLVIAWGQMLDHDLTFAAVPKGTLLNLNFGKKSSFFVIFLHLLSSVYTKLPLGVCVWGAFN